MDSVPHTTVAISPELIDRDFETFLVRDFHQPGLMQLDVLVAYIKMTGIQFLLDLQKILSKVRIRIITTLQWGTTQPEALIALGRISDLVEIKIFKGHETFHPKSWMFTYESGRKITYVGSANLSGAALKNSIEWNDRHVWRPGDVQNRVVEQSRSLFEQYWTQREVRFQNGALLPAKLIDTSLLKQMCAQQSTESMRSLSGSVSMNEAERELQEAEDRVRVSEMELDQARAALDTVRAAVDKARRRCPLLATGGGDGQKRKQSSTEPGQGLEVPKKLKVSAHIPAGSEQNGGIHGQGTQSLVSPGTSLASLVRLHEKQTSDEHKTPFHDSADAKQQVESIPPSHQTRTWDQSEEYALLQRTLECAYRGDATGSNEMLQPLRTRAEGESPSRLHSHISRDYAAWTAVMACTKFGDGKSVACALATLEKLLSLGLCPNTSVYRPVTTDYGGVPPRYFPLLYFASVDVYSKARKWYCVIRLILAHGADPNLRSPADMTVLDCLSQRCQYHTSHYCRANNRCRATISVRGQEYSAVLGGYDEMLKAHWDLIWELILRGAVPNVATQNGKFVYDGNFCFCTQMLWRRYKSLIGDLPRFNPPYKLWERSFRAADLTGYPEHGMVVDVEATRQLCDADRSS